MKYIHIIFLLINIISISRVQGQCVVDIVPPVAICQTSVTVYLDSSGTIEVQATAIDDNSFDNCGIETYAINGAASITVNCLDIGTFVPVELVVTDTTGNADTCTSFLWVEDNIPPKVECAPLGTFSVTLNATGTAPFPLVQATTGSSDNCGIMTTLINEELPVILTCDDVGIYSYMVEMEDSSGNIGWCQSQFEVTWGATCGFVAQLDSLGRTQCDTGVCTGYAALSSNGGTGAINYLWEDGSTALVRTDLCAGQYVVVATDFLGNMDTLVFRMRFDEDCVWPGDTDKSTRANNFDLLPIALAYGTSGGLRVDATNDWSGQSSNNWSNPLPLPVLPNYKHIDCNGDAVVDSLDVRAIRLNYAERYWRGSTGTTTTTNSSSHNQHPPLYVDCDTVREGEVHCMGVNLGDAATEAADAYAIAFTINYDPLLVESATITYDSSWLGVAAELISVRKDYATLGKIETAVGRIDHQSLIGKGRIGTVCFTIRDDILRSAPDTVVMPITINGIRFVDDKGNEKLTDPKEGCLTIIEVLNSVEDIKERRDINLYPNPTTGWVRISGLDDGFQKITVRTITGELLLSKTIEGQHNFELDLSGLPEAVYLVSIESSGQMVNKKLLILRG